MGDTRRVRNDLKQDESVMSVAVIEAFDLLNAGTRKHYRGAGDTSTAARERAAREAGISPAQAERLWKRWRTMGSVDGDVYRGLRNTYGRLCEWIENDAAAMERQAIEDNDATDQGHPSVGGSVARAPQSASRQEMR